VADILWVQVETSGIIRVKTSLISPQLVSTISTLPFSASPLLPFSPSIFPDPRPLALLSAFGFQL
jgi:hypothetical protein